MTEKPAKGGAYDELIANRTFVVLDIETTVKAATKDALEETYPISIGAVVLLNRTRRETFHELINPGVPVDKDSSRYNGIRTEDLADADDTATVLTHLDAFLARYPDAFVVCHNAYFDIVHIHSAYGRAKMTPFSRTVIDTEFLPIRLHLDGAVARPKLTALVQTYDAQTQLVGVPPEEERLHKALLDAQNTAEVLGWLMAEAAAEEIIDFDEFLEVAKAKSSDDIVAKAKRRRRRMRPPNITKTHIKTCHGKRGLAKEPTPEQVSAWVKQVTECVHVRCPYAAEKVTREADRSELLLPLFDTLLTSSSSAGQVGSLLVALEPLLSRLDRAQARRWYKTHHRHIKSAEPCDELHACPGCVAERPCPRDITYQLVTRRALDYGLTKDGKPINLLSRQVKDDIWDTGNDRKMDTLPDQGMPEMAAYMLWSVHSEATAKGNRTRANDILAKAVVRGLEDDDPRLALEVVKHWAPHASKAASITTLVGTMSKKATTDPGYLELGVWFDGPYQRMRNARIAAAKRQAKRANKGLRKPAPIERRPTDVKHKYRYQLHA